MEKIWRRFIWRLREFLNRLRHGSDSPRAAECLYVDPQQIRSYLNTRVTRHDTGRVMAGDWDQARHPIDQLTKIAICNRRFGDNLSWQEAGAYDHMARLLQRKEAPDGCRDMADVERRYERLDELYARLRNGAPFLSKQALKGAGAFREEGGIYVHVGHDGALLFGKRGCHRLAMARLLKLPVVPVQMGAVHRQALRDGSLKALRQQSRVLASRYQAGASPRTDHEEPGRVPH